MKRCSRCKKKKKLSAFSKEKAKKDGHRYYCKKCDKQYRIEYKEKYG